MLSANQYIDVYRRDEITFATSKVRFIRTLNESDDPVDETVCTFRTAMALTSSPYNQVYSRSLRIFACLEFDTG